MKRKTGKLSPFQEEGHLQLPGLPDPRNPFPPLREDRNAALTLLSLVTWLPPLLQLRRGHPMPLSAISAPALAPIKEGPPEPFAGC